MNNSKSIWVCVIVAAVVALAVSLLLSSLSSPQLGPRKDRIDPEPVPGNLLPDLIVDSSGSGGGGCGSMNGTVTCGLSFGLEVSNIGNERAGANSLIVYLDGQNISRFNTYNISPMGPGKSRTVSVSFNGLPAASGYNIPHTFFII